MPVVSDQARTYVFKIRKGVYFAPDPAFKGKPRELTAEDFAYTIKRFRDPANKSPYESFLGGVRRARRSQEGRGKDRQVRLRPQRSTDCRYSTVTRCRIKLKETDYNFAHILALPNTGAVAREVIEAYADDTNAHPVGTGPYTLKEWKRSNKIVLEANPSFRGVTWHFEPSDDPADKERIAAMEGKTMPQIGRVEISIIEEQQAAWLAFQNNELDILYLREQFAPVALPNNQVNAELARRGVTLSRTTDPDINYTYINTTDPEFGGFGKDKIALRRAIFMSFDNAEYIRVIRKGQAIDGAVPDPAWRHRQRSDLSIDRAVRSAAGQQAARLLRLQARTDGYRTWPDGKPLVWRYSSTPSSRDRELDELWQKSVERVGIRLRVDKNRFPEELKQERACQLLSRTASWIADYPDGDDFMQLFYGPNSHENNSACFQLAEWDRIYLKTKTMPDSPERSRL